MESPLVVYIIGDNRSGSTLLDYLLSSHPDAVSVGEVHHLHGHYCKTGTGKLWNWKCSCANDVRTCIFWSKIIEDISFSKTNFTKFKNPILKNSLFYRSKNKNKLIRTLDEKFDDQGKAIAKTRWKIYKSVQRISGKSLIIDSSKSALEAYFLYKYRQGDIKFILLERNIWEVAYSKLTRVQGLSTEIKEFYDIKEHSIYKYLVSSYNVLKKNQSIFNIIQKKSNETIIKEVKYLNLTTNTKKEIDRLCSFLKTSSFNPPSKTNQNDIPQHILGGSRSRNDKKLIKPDKRWKSYFKAKPLAYILGKTLQGL